MLNRGGVAPACIGPQIAEQQLPGVRQGYVRAVLGSTGLFWCPDWLMRPLVGAEALLLKGKGLCSRLPCGPEETAGITEPSGIRDLGQ